MKKIGRMSRLIFAPALVIGCAAWASAQEPNPTATPSAQQSNGTALTQAGTLDNVPLYKIQVVGRDIPAINYFHRSGSTKIGFQGTSLLPGAKGYRQGGGARGPYVH